MASDKEIIRAWKDLVISHGAAQPRKIDPDFIFNEWCPDGTSVVNHIKQKRPELREILRQSLSGDLSLEAFDGLDRGKRQFMLLWYLIHGSLDPIAEEELRKWSRYNVPGVRQDLWVGVTGDTKRSLRAALMRVLSFEQSMANLKVEMNEWIESYREQLNRLKELSGKNPDLVEKSSANPREQIALGQSRINGAMKIKAKLNPLVQEMKDKMRLEVFDAVFSGSALSEPPDWATMIDGAKVDTTVNRIGECMSLEVDTPESGLDALMKKLEEIMSGPVEDILKQISELTN